MYSSARAHTHTHTYISIYSVFKHRIIIKIILFWDRFLIYPGFIFVDGTTFYHMTSRNFKHSDMASDRSADVNLINGTENSLQHL